MGWRAVEGLGMQAEQVAGLGVAALAQAALRIGGMIAAVWGVLLIVMQVMPGTGISFYPATWLMLAALSLVMLASVAARPFYIRHGKTASFRDTVVLFAMLAVPVAVMACVVEAKLSHDLLKQLQPISFAEVLWQPPATRYAITAVFGASFLSGAMGATLFGCLFQFPTKLRALDRMVQRGG